MNRSIGLLVGLAAGFVVAAACSGSYLKDPTRDDAVRTDDFVTIEGEFCAPSTSESIRPIKILIAIDASESMKTNDPLGTRAQAVVDLIDTLPQEQEIYFLVMVFAGSITTPLSKSGLREFERIVDYTDADRFTLRQKILSFANTSADPNRDATDFVKPLSDIYSIVNRDIATAKLATSGTVEASSRYSVIFLSDGQPTENQDKELLCDDAVRRIRQLKEIADDVTLNTVHVFIPTRRIDSSHCDIDAGTVVSSGSSCLIPIVPPGACPLLLINQNAERLAKMAEIGGGNFRDFRNNEPVNFLNFKFGQVRRAYLFDKIVASNFSAPAGSPPDTADTDSDGLLDADEALAGTSPWVADTDGDGFTDGIEVYFKARGAPFTPNQVLRPDGGGLDPGCPPELRGVDQDCDGLTDCDEQIVGTNALRVDSDDDGVADSVEFKLGTQPSAYDLDQDPDNDLLSNGAELEAHTDPFVPDTEELSVAGYRSEIDRNGSIDAEGRQCFHFRIKNVRLANTIPDTRDAGNPDGGEPLFRRGAGYNDIFLSLSTKPWDDPAAPSTVRTYRDRSIRFPVGGIRSPHDGIIRVGTVDFQLGCPSAVTPTAP